MATSKDALIAELAAVQDAKLLCLKTGQAVVIPGATQSTAVSYRELCTRERELRSRLLRAGMAPARIRPNYLTDVPSEVPE